MLPPAPLTCRSRCANASRADGQAAGRSRFGIPRARRRADAITTPYGVGHFVPSRAASSQHALFSVMERAASSPSPRHGLLRRRRGDIHKGGKTLCYISSAPSAAARGGTPSLRGSPKASVIGPPSLARPPLLNHVSWAAAFSVRLPLSLSLSKEEEEEEEQEEAYVQTGAGALHSSARSSPGRSVTRSVTHARGVCAALRTRRPGGVPRVPPTSKANCPTNDGAVRLARSFGFPPPPLVIRAWAGGTNRKIRTHHGKTRAPDSAFQEPPA